MKKTKTVIIDGMVFGVDHSNTDVKNRSIRLLSAEAVPPLLSAFKFGSTVVALTAREKLRETRSGMVFQCTLHPFPQKKPTRGYASLRGLTRESFLLLADQTKN